jgi:hypothetical protein
MPSDDRDRQLDQALARHLRRPSPDPCPDAEILAAYHEGTLARDELLAFNQHLADCKMCRESLAILAESDEMNAGNEEWKKHKIPKLDHVVLAASPAPVAAASKLDLDSRAEASVAAIPSQSPKKTRARALRFLIPIGALAAVGLVWVGLHERNVTSQVAQLREPSAIPPPPMASTQPATPENSTPLHAQSMSSGTPPAAKKEKSSAPEDQSYSRRETLNELRQRAAQDQLASNLEQSEYAKSLRITPRPGAGRLGAAVGSAAPSAAGSRTSKGVATTSQPGTSADVISSQAPPTPAPKSAAASAQQSNLQVSSMQSYLRDMAATNPAVILSPDKTQIWMVGNGGGIKHSSGDAEIWITQDSGVASDLLAGSAASSSTVWIVGKSGTILLTTDGGANWKKVPSPVPGDLAGVQATDAKRATVRDLANHQFATTDGGATWKPLAN